MFIYYTVVALLTAGNQGVLLAHTLWCDLLLPSYLHN